jgi:hypothetical protein
LLDLRRVDRWGPVECGVVGDGEHTSWSCWCARDIGRCSTLGVGGVESGGGAGWSTGGEFL